MTINRRDFSKFALTAGAALLAPKAALHAADSPVSPPQSSADKFDLLIQGGTVIDPSQNLNGAMDVAIHEGKILEVSKAIAPERAAKIVSARDRIVTPGFIDLHNHCYDGMGTGTNADHSSLGRGVTTVVDAGSAGYVAFPNFRKYVINNSATRIMALVHVNAIGNMMYEGALANLNWVNPQLTAKMAIDNRPIAVGIKIQLTKAITGANDMEGLKRALEAANISRLPLMVHIEDSYSPLPDLLNQLRKGDVYTHCYNNRTHGILNAGGEIIPEAHAARARGVFFDIAQGQTHLSFDVAEKCMQQNFLPDSISTDLTSVTVERRVFDLPTMVSKFLAIGLPLDKAIGMVTANPARVFDYAAQIGSLKPDSEADVSIFELRDGKFDFEDSDGVVRTGRQRLFNKIVVRHGRVIVNEV